MLNNYNDIMDRIDEEPRWFDAKGVPRYCEMHPDNCSDIYADKVAFYRIECQNCSYEFLVEFTTSKMDRIRYQMMIGVASVDMTVDVEDLWDAENLHYGDPPNIGCCSAGATMNSCPRELISLWERRTKNQPNPWEWVKTKENIPVRADWDKEDEDEGW